MKTAMANTSLVSRSVRVTPSAAISTSSNGDWIHQRSDSYDLHTPLGRKDQGTSIFATFSRGLESGRDAWVYNYSKKNLIENIRRTAEYFMLAVTSPGPGKPQLVTLNVRAHYV